MAFCRFYAKECGAAPRLAPVKQRAELAADIIYIVRDADAKEDSYTVIGQSPTRRETNGRVGRQGPEQVRRNIMGRTVQREMIRHA